MTIAETQSITTEPNHRTGRAGRRHLGVHLPAENRSWRLVVEYTLEVITSRVYKHVEKSQPVHLEMKQQVNSESDVDTQTSDCKYT